MASNKQLLEIAEVKPIALMLEMFCTEQQWRAKVCGSIRRGCQVVGDIDLVVGAPIKLAIESLKEKTERKGAKVEVVSNMKNVKVSADFLLEGIQVNVYSVQPESWGAMLLFLTGDWQFNVVMRARAKAQGSKMNQYGIWRGEEQLAGVTEEQMFMCLGLHYVRPGDRSYTKMEAANWPIKYK